MDSDINSKQISIFGKLLKDFLLIRQRNYLRSFLARGLSKGLSSLPSCFLFVVVKVFDQRLELDLGVLGRRLRASGDCLSNFLTWRDGLGGRCLLACHSLSPKMLPVNDYGLGPCWVEVQLTAFQLLRKLSLDSYVFGKGGFCDRSLNNGAAPFHWRGG